MPADALLVYCTCPDDQSARTIAQHLVEERLAACVSITAAITSIYQWQGKSETAEERLLLIKTTTGRYTELEQRIPELHPYELPEIIAVPIEHGLPGYMNWINKCTEE